MAASYMQTALVTHALKQSSIIAVFGQSVYFGRAPQRTPKPYAVLNTVAGSGDSEEFGECRMGQPLMQWTTVSKGDSDKTPCDAFIGAYALLDVFSNFQGAMEGVTIKVIWGGGQPLEIPSRATDDRTYICELEVHYEEP